MLRRSTPVRLAHCLRRQRLGPAVNNDFDPRDSATLFDQIGFPKYVPKIMIP
jgi:hypothetical protein